MDLRNKKDLETILDLGAAIRIVVAFLDQKIRKRMKAYLLLESGGVEPVMRIGKQRIGEMRLIKVLNQIHFVYERINMNPLVSELLDEGKLRQTIGQLLDVRSELMILLPEYFKENPILAPEKEVLQWLGHDDPKNCC